MSDHLTQKQGEGYCRQELSALELLAVSDHLGACEACRRQVESARNRDGVFFSLRSAVFGETPETAVAIREHLSFEQAAGYVDGMLAAAEHQVLTDHLSRCGQCAAVVADLRAFRNQISSELDHEYGPTPVYAPKASWRDRVVSALPFLRRPSRLAFATALAAVLLAVTGMLIWRAMSERQSRVDEIVVSQPQPESVEPTKEVAPAVVAQLNDGDGKLSLDEEGKLSGADHLPPAYQLMLMEALTDQDLDRSSLLKGLVRPSSSLMGAGKQANTFAVLDPLGRVLLSDRPSFRWSRLEGATSYSVEVYDAQFNLVAKSPEVTEPSWTASKALKRGGIYSWQVAAMKDGQEIKCPRPPVPQAKFRILDQARATELAEARRSFSSSHLTLGILYAEAGLVEEAQEEFRALEKANPDSPIARKLLANVQAMRR